MAPSPTCRLHDPHGRQHNGHLDQHAHNRGERRLRIQAEQADGGGQGKRGGTGTDWAGISKWPEGKVAVHARPGWEGPEGYRWTAMAAGGGARGGNQRSRLR